MPSVVVWESTKACDFNCKHCRAFSLKERLPDELTAHEIEKYVIDRIHGMFVISGGDALKRDDIFEIARYSSSRVMTALSPSGSRISKDVAKMIKDAGIKAVSISIDGPETIHDSFRGVQGAFRMSSEAIKNVKEEGIWLQINTTISKFNIDHLDQVKEAVMTFNPNSWDIFVLVPTGRATRGMEILPIQNEMLMLKVRQWRKEGLNVRMTCNPYFVRFSAVRGDVIPGYDPEKGRGSAGGARGCMASNGFLFIAYNGDVYPCGFLPIKLGNVREERLDEIYNSPLSKEVGDPNLLEGKCGVCEYKLYCGGCRARVCSKTKNIHAQDDFCLYHPKVMYHDKRFQIS
ncbi:radical SAM/SPASM domain-containing protein [Sulfuracidifex metallicus]|uniref:radical SAM/SPASM domain-containing protein n=1 Tax=Sulfuracidifex metallicus TaxID=47303 RepID=UPI002273FC8C|nr:radical SAM protein [Sulfuracidifex metallicus]MCY0851021.1 radical SAM protein [Sulfuracidifex metallicus]